MLIHKLTKIIKQDTDDNISFVECDHPFSGVARSQVILTFKEQKTRVSVVQISDASKMYICIISRKGKKTEGDFGGFAEYAMLRLRLCDGLDYATAAERGIAVPPDFAKKCEKYAKLGLMVANSRGVRFTKKGFLVQNAVLCDIL